MSDVFTPKKRSEVMSKIKGKGNKSTELLLASIMRKHHITGWRRNQPVFGKPDFIFRKQKVAIFVDGCFWHCCPQHSNVPKNNREFWEKKLNANKERDLLVTKTLQKKGWNVIRIWEHELKEPDIVASKITSTINQ
ncbi:MAG: very short patch repair endonuclease [Chloroflexi bacterium]|nr:very short patch repair endonuclease [Chloroflexota bacterium]